jgi:hypothetical protein
MRQIAFWVTAVIAFVLFPDDMDGKGLFADIAVLVGVLLVVTPVLVHFAILQSLPEKVAVSPATASDVTPEMHAFVRQYRALGFEPAGEPLRFHLPQEAVLVALVNADEKMIATVYRIEGKQKKLAHDIVSCLDVPNGGLTTAHDVGAGVLPAAPATLRQIFPGQTPGELFFHHQNALSYLASRHLAALDVAPSAVAGLIVQSFKMNRHTFVQARVTNTLKAIWRTLTKSTPDLGPIAEQKGVDARLEALPRRRPLRRPAAHSRA